MTKSMASIIIPVKNGMPKFQKVIEKVAEQEFHADYEVIIIDSGSTDGSKDVVPTKDARFRLIEIEPSSFGHGKTRNLGIRAAKGDFCAFLTHDAIPADVYWLQNLVKPLLEDEKVAGVFGRHLAYPNADPYTTWELENHFNGLKKWPKIWIEDQAAYRSNEGLRQIYHFYSDNSSCLRKSVWEQYPYPEVDFAEDQLWAQQIIEAGYRKAYAFDSVVYHSHNYSIWERMQRSYDEARALHHHFGYIFCRSKKQLIRQTWLTNKHDFLLGVKNRWFLRHPIAFLKRPFINLARQIGHYLATHHSQFIHEHANKLSRDKQLREK